MDDIHSHMLTVDRLPNVTKRLPSTQVIKTLREITHFVTAGSRAKDLPVGLFPVQPLAVPR